MIKYFLTGVGVLAVAASGAALTNLGNLDDPGVSRAGSVLLNGSASRADLIYDDQTYDYAYLTNGLSIYGGAGYETADDFVPDDDVIVNEIVIWLSGQDIDLRVDWFADSGGPADAPPADFYNEEVSSSDITWEDTGDTAYGWPVIKCTVPISDCELTGGTKYWLGFQNTTGPNTFWWAFDYGTMGGPYWEETYFYYVSYWYQDQWPYGQYDHFYELYGIVDYNDPEITETYPHDSDFPSGVPVDTNVTFRVTDDVSGCDTGETTCTVEENGGPVSGDLTYDDSDPLDVAFEWEPDDDYTEGASIDAEVVTYDLAGNGPVTETWTFDVGYTNVVERSFGAIKAKFR